jgi:S-layer protein (TIGR01567 family)
LKNENNYKFIEGIKNMAIKKYLQGIAIVVLILGMLSVTMAITINSPTPSSPISNVIGDPARSFSINTSSNATIEWQINGTTKFTSLANVTTSTYTNSSFRVGIWNVTAIAANSSHLSEIDTETWLWTITAPALVVDTAPIFTVDPTHDPQDTSANISFSINQSNANTTVRYGLNPSTLISESIWKNGSSFGTSRIIQLSGLSSGTQYYYSVYAYNESNNTLYKNSTPNNFTTKNPSLPNVSNITKGIPTTTTISISFEVNQTDSLTSIFYGTNPDSLGSSTSYNTLRTVPLSGLSPGTLYFFSIYAKNVTNQSYISNSTIQNFTTIYPAPKKSGTTSPATPLTTTGSDNQTFSISFDQAVNVTWSSNSSVKMPAPNISVTSATLLMSSPGVGTWYIKASWINDNGSDNYTWIWNVRPTTFFSGNRIWDGSRQDLFGLTYTWTPMSFSGFYYNAKDDVGNENIQITLGSYDARTISAGKLIYTTSPQEVSFTYSLFGKYQVIGFMAEKYFAGYTLNTTPPHPSSNFNEISAVGQGQLHKVLIDDDTKRTIAVGGTFALQEGYVLKATDIDLNARTMLLSLLKDGNEVDSTPLSADQTYVYRKRVGSVSDLPIIMVRFDSVFSGSEVQVAFLKGLFQISENPTIISSGNTFRNMEVTAVSSTSITMENSNAISLSKGSTNDVMGDVKILVANNEDNALRFALSVEKTGDYEVRSTVYRSDDTNPIKVWTPYNFGMNIGQTSIGFFYDLDDGVGREQLKLNSISGRIIDDQGLEYSTSPVPVKFTYTGFGKYNVIGFMADKYFASYTSDTNPTVTRPSTTFAGKSSLANGALLKVLIDDDTKRTIAVGGTIALKEGYVLKATDIDLNARVMLISLLKDGSEVDTTPLAAGETYVYAKRVGSTDNLPLIMVRFENVFSGSELQVGFLKGIFQISDTPTIITTTEKFGKMEVTAVSDTGITMLNDGSISLDKNKNDVLMGNIRLKVADNIDAATRFYFAVDVTPEMISNQLAIEAPAKAMAGDTIKIKITAGGVGLNNATINIGTDSATTDLNGILNYTLPKTLKGTYSITASMTGYEKATQNIEIEKYVDYRLSLEAPSMANQFETITIKVLYNGTAMSGANVNFDNTTVGTSDSNGEVTYKLETSGTHSISASKISYITVTRDIEIRAPYSDFRGLDLNITPNSGFVGESYLVKANITNIGTMSDSKQIDLIVNGTSVANKTITLGAKEKIEVNFTRIEPIAGNVTVEIMGQSMLYEAKDKPTNYLLIAAIATVIGAVIIYVLTSKGLLSREILKDKCGLLADKFNNLFKK